MIQYYTAILIICWIALLAMCILVYENDRISRNDKRLMYLTYVLVAVSAFAECSGIHLDGREDLPDWTLMLAKCADYIFTPMAGGAMALQLQQYNIWRKLMIAVLVVNTALQIISAPFEWMVVIDAQSRYSHGPLYPVYLGVCLAIILLLVIQFMLYGKQFKRQNRVSVYAIMLVVLTALFIQHVPPSYRTAYIGETFGAILLFIHYNEFSQLVADERLAEQRIQLMLSQIKPHFLYNTLGSIEALCDRDPKAAKMATRKFSRYLRGNMYSLTEEKLIHFEKELQHTQLYLELEKIRFGDALDLEYDINANDFLIPPLTLEPIAENAVKHGIRMNADGRGTVRITASELADRYELTVTDDGPGCDPEALFENNTRVGIKNVRERLGRICGGSLTIAPAPQRGTIVTIQLPKERIV